MKRILALIVIFSLSGCQTQEEIRQDEENESHDIRYIQKEIPPDCSFKYVGKVRVADERGRATQIFMINCSGRATTTTSTSTIVPSGKSTIVINGVTYTIESVDEKR